MVKIKNNARHVYEKIFDALYSRYNDSSKAYNRMLEFLAADNCPPMLADIGERIEWFFSDRELSEQIAGVYDLSEIKSDYHDHLGDLYEEHVIGPQEAKRKGLYLTPQPVVEVICKSTLEGAKDKEVNILDPCTGTGRFLLAAARYAPKGRLFGVDRDLTMIRTAFTNAAIHNVSMYLLHADSLRHEIDIAKEDGRANWRYANRWDSQMDKLKASTTPDKEIKKAIQPSLFY